MASATAADPSLVNGTEVRAGGSSRDGDLEEEESGNGQREEVVEAPQGYQQRDVCMSIRVNLYVSGLTCT